MRTNLCRISPSSRADGFTLTDLLTVMVILGVLIVVLLPALASTKPNSQGALCMANQRQLIRAWQMYADDNSGGLVASLGGGASTYNGRPVWVTGAMVAYTSNSGTWDTNQDIVKSPLWTYVNKNPAVFKCPADTSTVTVGTNILPRVRSISMSQVFDEGIWLRAANWRVYAKTADIVKPAKTFVFIDENPISINDGGFATQCDGLPGSGTNSLDIIDTPASYHNKAGVLSFADGHADIHQWRGPIVLNDYYSPMGTNAGNIADATYLAENTTVRK